MAKSVNTGRASTHDSTELGRIFKQRLGANEVLLGGIVFEMIRPPIVKIYRHAGFHFIYADNEHTLFAGQPAMADFVLCARDNGLPIIAKCPELERPEVARLLEAGVVGIQLPRTESRQDLLTLIDFMKFPPEGSRAAAPILGNVDYIPPSNTTEWMARTNQATCVVAHIETRRGLENAEEIVSTPGVDMVYIGPLDFSISMGHPGEYDHPEVTGAMQKVLDLCLQHGVAFGTTASGPETAGRWISRGARFFETIDELTLLIRGAVETVNDYQLAVKTVQTVHQRIQADING